jgi:hypothetical protein
MKETLNQLILYCTMGEELSNQEILVKEYEKKIKQELIAKIVKIRDFQEIESADYKRGYSNAIIRVLEIL